MGESSVVDLFQVESKFPPERWGERDRVEMFGDEGEVTEIPVRQIFDNLQPHLHRKVLATLTGDNRGGVYLK